MKLSEYLDLNRMSDPEFAALVKRDRTSVYRWRQGATQPDWPALQAILEATHGQVTPNDFLDVKANEAAE